MMFLRDLILMEAPKAKPPGDDAENPDEPELDKGTPPKQDNAEDDPGGKDKPADDEALSDKNDDLATDSDFADDEEDDSLGGEASQEQQDPVVGRLRRGELFDAITEVRNQCKTLIDSAGFLLDRVSDPTAQRLASKANNIATEAERQCGILQTNFSEFGYDRVRAVYLTVRERVSAVAEVLKHVIDGDEDFRQPDSGSAETNRNAKQGRGRDGK